MRKQGKLYTVNKWNRPLFEPDENLFYNGGGNNPFSVLQPVSGVSITGIAPSPTLYIDPLLGQRMGMTSANATRDLQKSVATGVSSGIGSAALNAGFGAASGLIGDIAGNVISGGLESNAGNAVGTIGGTVGSAVSAVNPILGAGISVGSKLIGGLTNRAFGTSVDQGKLNAANEGTAQLRNFNSNANSFDALEGPQSVAAVQDAYKGGWFSKSEARRRNAELRKQREEAQSWAVRSLDNNVFNLQDEQLNDALANYSAFGGPIEMFPMSDGMGAIGYGFMSDYLSNKKRQSEQKGQTNMFAGVPNGMFAFGGDMETNYGDFSTGLTHIDAGRSHELNPNDGVQMGVDQNGTPNLVEENETVYENYVFSNRILADDATKKLFHLPKKKDITFADISKRLEKEIAERPNDGISKAGFKAQMQQLEEQQERQKREMEAERAKAAFEALSPEEKTALMQQASNASSSQDGQWMKEMPIAGELAARQPSPEETVIAQQQESQPLQEEVLAQQQAVAALGGRLVNADNEEANRFDFGGYKKGSRKARKLAKRMDEEWFKNQAKVLGIPEEDMKKFVFSSVDPEANLNNFNAIYLNSQKKNALDTYMKGQRKAKENELFGENGMYRMSDDGNIVYKARVRKDGEDWINSQGEVKSQEDYNKLSDSDKEAYRQIKSRVGDKLYDYNNKLMEDEYKQGKDALLNSFAYDEGFKWDDKDAQTLQYPVEMENSGASYLRYIPALGGAVGLFNDLFSSPYYGRADAVINASSALSKPAMVHPNYRPTYMKPHVFDIWQQRNRNAANLNSAIRTFNNTVSPNKNANILAALYNATNADGQLGIDADKYNREDAFRVASHNSGENKTLAQLDMQAQTANQNALLQGSRYGLQGIITGNQMKDQIDAQKAASRNANLTNLLTSIGNIGEEAYDEDRLKWLERTGVLKSNYFGQKSAEGGRIRRKKKGLTY